MKAVLSLILLVLISFSGFSQIDNEYWGSISFEKKIIKKTRLNLNLGYRIENIVDNNSKFVQLGVKRKLPFKLKLEVGYRYTNKENYKHQFRYTHRPFINLSKGFKLIKFRFTFRTKFQWEFKNQLSRKKNDLQDFAWRNKLKVSKKIFKRAYVFAASELFSFKTESFFNKYRLAGGFKYGITKKIDLSLMSMYEKEVHDNGEGWIIGVSYAHRL